MSFNYFKVITAAALLVIPGASFANASEFVIDNNGDLRITLAGGDFRNLRFSRFSPADPVFPDDDGLELLPVTGGSTFTVRLMVDGSSTLEESYFGFSGDIYIEADEDDAGDLISFEDVDFVDFFNNLNGNSVNILSGPGDDLIQVVGSRLVGLDVRAREGEDMFNINLSSFSAPVVLRGFSGIDDFFIEGNTFSDDLRIRGGRDDDFMMIMQNFFGGEVTRFNGRAGNDQLNHQENIPLLTTDDFRNLENVNDFN